MDLSIRTLSMLAIKTIEFEITEIGDEEGVDLSFGIKDSLLLNVGGGLFYCLMLCKWTTSLAYSTYMILPMKTKLYASRNFVMSLKWSHVR